MEEEEATNNLLSPRVVIPLNSGELNVRKKQEKELNARILSLFKEIDKDS